MNRPTLHIRRLRLLLPPRMRKSAAADARTIAQAAALALHQNASLGSEARDAVVELPQIHTQGGGRPVAALAHDVAGRIGSAIRSRRGA